MRTSIAFLFLLPAALAQGGTLYKCSSESGTPTYTNNREGYRNCIVVSRENSTAAVMAPSPTSKAKTAAPSPVDFPRVSIDTQKSRDNDRMTILRQELAAEQKNLDEARKALSEQEVARVPADKLQSWRDRIALHTRNLDALQRELGKIK